MPSKPLFGIPVVVGISEAVMAIRNVLSAMTGCCDTSNAASARAADR